MNWIIENPISIALGWTLLHFLWQGCAIAILTKLVLEVFKKSSSNTRYAIACAGFLAMAILPCITFSSNWQRTSQVAASNAAEPGLEVPPNSQFTTPSTPVEPELVADAQLATDSPNVPATDARGQAASDWFGPQTLAALRLRLQPLLPWLVVGWFAGVGLLSLRLVLSWRQLRKMQTTGLHKVTDYQQRVCAELCKALRVRQAVKIAHSALVEVPTLVGWLQPIVLLPMSAMSGLEQSQLRALLAHELAHVRRADFAVNLLQTVIETLLFYHPAVWWLSACIRQERENCCDDLAVAECRDGRSYVEALLRMEELRNTALAMSARGGNLMQRASRLLEPGNAHRKTGVQPPVGAALFSLLLLALVAVVSTSILPGSTANAEDPQASAGSEERFETEWTDDEIMPEKIINKIPAKVLTHPIKIVGQAKDVDGNPISGATIYVASHKGFHKLLKTTTTDENGKYAFGDLKLPTKKADGASSLGSGRFEIYGSAENYAFAWRSQKSYHLDLGGNTIIDRESPDPPGHFEGNDPIRLDLTFQRPAPLSGTIVDQDGNPIADTKVHLFNCWYAPTEELSDVAMAQFGTSSLYSKNYCPPKISTVRTNDKGEFKFANAPPECRYRISIKPPGFASRMIIATTESNSKAYLDDSRRTFFSKDRSLEANGMRLVFQSPREIQIQLTGLAKPEYGYGAHVNPHNLNAGASGISNENGIAKMKLPPGEYKVAILPPIHTPYWRTEREITVTADPSQSFELEMTPAAVVDIQLVDESGDRVEGAAGFDLWAEGKNGQRNIHYFRNYERATGICHVHRVRTDDRGKMKANFLPGKYRIGIGQSSKPDGWRIIERRKKVDLKVGEPTTVTFRVRPPDNGEF